MIELKNITAIASVSLEERETIINICADDALCYLYTSDNAMLRKMKKNMELHPKDFKCKEKYVDYDTQLPVGYEFVFPMKCLSFKASKRDNTRTYTEEEKKAIAERFRKAREINENTNRN